ncbi:tRNA synthetases class I family protein, partial [Chlamydia psittaci 06-1683]
RLARKC